MLNNDESAESKWLPVIGRALAYLCMKQETAEHQSVQERAKFLEGLGLSRADAASMLGTTADSLRVMHGRAQRKKKAKRGTAKKKSRRSR
jgi:hypothetical protein